VASEISLAFAGGLQKALPVFSSVAGGGGWYPIINEPWGGAWQTDIKIDSTRDILGFGAVFACVTIIASDIAKLRLKLLKRNSEKIYEEAESAAFDPVLRKPNNFQNRIQFIEYWIISKILYGNTYVLKVRDARRVVTALYILNPQRVKPLITADGDVYYQMDSDELSGLPTEITLPASEIIHDRMNCLFHPLVGVSPIYSAAVSATMGNKIQNNSSTFFKNMSRPSGMLTAPGIIPDETAARIKNDWETNYGGQNIGRIAVAGSGLEFKTFTLPAEQSQLVEQLDWTVRDVAMPFHIPPFKLGGPVPPYNTVTALNLIYYENCLQKLIEDLELCLEEGLSLPSEYDIKVDVDGLMRMDSAAQVEMLTKASGGAYMKPNEARAIKNLSPVEGGDALYKQQQDFSISALAKRDARDPFLQPEAPPLPTTQPPEPNDDTEKRIKEAERLAQEAKQHVLEVQTRAREQLEKALSEHKAEVERKEQQRIEKAEQEKQEKLDAEAKRVAEVAEQMRKTAEEVFTAVHGMDEKFQAFMKKVVADEDSQDMLSAFIEGLDGKP
jgi:HK97 family phage portal protein